MSGKRVRADWSLQINLGNRRFSTQLSRWSPNSIIKRANAGLPSQIGMVHFFEAPFGADADAGNDSLDNSSIISKLRKDLDSTRPASG